MSRYYELSVEFRGISLDEVSKVVLDKFGWEKEDSGNDYLICRGSLYGGRSDEKEHEEIYKELKKLKPFCRIKTQWTYLENLPYEEYGDDLEKDELQVLVEEKIKQMKNKK